MMTNRLRYLQKQKGFTFVELVIAMALFAFVLVIISATIIQLYRIYQATVGIRNTQQAARLIAEELTRQARGAGAVDVVTGPAGYGQTTVTTGTVPTQHDVVCFYTSPKREEGTMFYTFTTGQNRQELWRRSVSSAADCVRPATAQGERIANADNVSFLRFQVTPTGNDLATFRMTVASTSAVQPVDLGQSPLAANNVTCAEVAIRQWCSITQLTTSVALREVNR